MRLLQRLIFAALVLVLALSALAGIESRLQGSFSGWMWAGVSIGAAVLGWGGAPYAFRSVLARWIVSVLAVVNAIALLPLLLLVAALGLAGRLGDTSVAENRNAGLAGLALAIGVLLPTIGWFVMLARQRVPAGVCPGCGYDLRGTPGARRCPECGAALAQTNEPGAEAPGS